MTEVDVLRYATIRDGKHSFPASSTGSHIMQEWPAMSWDLTVIMFKTEIS